MTRILAAVSVGTVVLAGPVEAQSLEPMMSAQDITPAHTDPTPEHILVPIMMMLALVLTRF